MFAEIIAAVTNLSTALIRRGERQFGCAAAQNRGIWPGLKPGVSYPAAALAPPAAGLAA